jgi:hypothetical protein
MISHVILRGGAKCQSRKSPEVNVFSRANIRKAGGFCDDLSVAQNDVSSRTNYGWILGSSPRKTKVIGAQI